MKDTNKITVADSTMTAKSRSTFLLRLARFEAALAIPSFYADINPDSDVITPNQRHWGQALGSGACFCPAIA